jgi:hypothetical protein
MPRRNRKPKRIKLQVGDHVDVNISFSVYASRKAALLISGLAGAGGGSWWFLLHR